MSRLLLGILCVSRRRRCVCRLHENQVIAAWIATAAGTAAHHRDVTNPTKPADPAQNLNANSFSRAARSNSATFAVSMSGTKPSAISIRPPWSKLCQADPSKISRLCPLIGVKSRRWPRCSQWVESEHSIRACCKSVSLATQRSLLAAVQHRIRFNDLDQRHPPQVSRSDFATSCFQRSDGT
jgi:hypothetical protein